MRREVNTSRERAISMSCIRQLTKSVADLFDKAPNWSGLSILCLIAAIIRRLAISLSSPLPRHERSEIGLHDLGELRSLLFGLGRNTISAFLKISGWYPNLMQFP